MESTDWATSVSAAILLADSTSAGLASIFARAKVWNVMVWGIPSVRLSSIPASPESQ